MDQARFQFYIGQDALYLDQYARVLAMAGARGPGWGNSAAVRRSALEAIAVEQALHAEYLTQFGSDGSKAEPSPDCLSYTSFLLATAYHDPWESSDGSASALLLDLLGCGQSHCPRGGPDNPYHAWINTYSDEAFGNAVQAVIAATDQAAEGASGAIRRPHDAGLYTIQPVMSTCSGMVPISFGAGRSENSRAYVSLYPTSGIPCSLP